MIELFLNRMSKISHNLFAGKYLRPYERLVLDGWFETLPVDKQQVLAAQRKAVDFVQRQAGDAKVCFYYRKGEHMPLFRNVQPDVHAATVLLRSAKATESQMLPVKIFIHRGQLFSIEFPKRPKRYMKQHHMQAEQLRVAAVEEHRVL